MAKIRIRERRAVLLAFTCSGAAGLAYEVVWTRALSVVLGSTTHAVSTMLASFMLGLALGGAVGGHWADRVRDPIRSLGLAEMAIGCSALLGLPILMRVPAAYLWLYRHFHLYPTLFFAGQVAVCAAIMLVPTFLMGLTFPMAAKALSHGDDVGRQVGTAYSANTLGALVGSLGAGFALIPALGLTRATAVAAAANLLAGALLLLVSRAPARRALPLALLLLAAAAAAWTARPQWSLVSVYSAFRYSPLGDFESVSARERRDMTLLHESDDAEGQLRAFRDKEGYLLLQIGGKLEGTNAKDLDNTTLLAWLPAASHPSPRSMLVVGLGAGVTVAMAKQQVERVSVVEIHPGVVDAVRRFGVPGTLDGVEVVVADARNYLARTERTFDLISAEPSYPTQAAVANLFTREYYQLAAKRLSPGGLYCQWLPYYLLTNDDVTLAVKTFASVFPNAMLWKIPKSMDLILVGGTGGPAMNPEQVMARVQAMAPTGRKLDLQLSRDAQAIAAILADPTVPVDTDDHPLLEFRVARNLRVGDLSLLERAQP